MFLREKKKLKTVEILILPYDKGVFALTLIPLRHNICILMCKNSPWHSTFLLNTVLFL